MFGMWSSLFHVNSPSYFQQWNTYTSMVWKKVSQKVGCYNACNVTTSSKLLGLVIKLKLKWSTLQVSHTSQKMRWSDIKYSLVVNCQTTKPEKWLSQKYKLQPFVSKKVPIWEQLLVNKFRVFPYSFTCMKWFSSNLAQKLWLAFLIYLRFLKRWYLVKWLKCLQLLQSETWDRP